MAASGQTQRIGTTDLLQALPARDVVPASQNKQRGRGGKVATMAMPPASTSSAPAPPKKVSVANIVWEGQQTDLLVDWIITHTADQHILFYDSRLSSTSTSTPRPSPEDKPSGKNKKIVSAVIAKHIFEKDRNHSIAYNEDSSRYVTSVINRLNVLKTKYREHRARFKSTGSGISPDGGETEVPAQNLLEDVLRVFPYYLELDAVWNGIPSFDSQLISSKLSVNHAKSLLHIIRSKPAPSNDVTVNLNEEDNNVNMQDEDVIGVGEGGAPAAPPGDMDDHCAQGDGTDDERDFGDEVSAMEGVVPSHQQSDTHQVHVQPKSSMSFSLRSKGKTPARDGRSTFTKYSPYSRPPSSGASTISMKTAGSASKPTTSIKKAGSGTVNSFTEKLDKLGKASEVLASEVSPGPPSSKALRYTYAICSKELDNQKAELDFKKDNARVEFEHEECLKILEIQLADQELHKIDQQIQLLCMQMEYQRQMQSMASPPPPLNPGPMHHDPGPSLAVNPTCPSLSTVGPGPSSSTTAAGPTAPSLFPGPSNLSCMTD